MATETQAKAPKTPPAPELNYPVSQDGKPGKWLPIKVALINGKDVNLTAWKAMAATMGLTPQQAELAHRHAQANSPVPKDIAPAVNILRKGFADKAEARKNKEQDEAALLAQVEQTRAEISQHTSEALSLSIRSREELALAFNNGLEGLITADSNLSLKGTELEIADGANVVTTIANAVAKLQGIKEAVEASNDASVNWEVKIAALAKKNVPLAWTEFWPEAQRKNIAIKLTAYEKITTVAAVLSDEQKQIIDTYSVSVLKPASQARLLPKGASQEEENAAKAKLLAKIADKATSGEKVTQKVIDAMVVEAKNACGTGSSTKGTYPTYVILSSDGSASGCSSFTLETYNLHRDDLIIHNGRAHKIVKEGGIYALQELDVTAVNSDVVLFSGSLKGKLFNAPKEVPVKGPKAPKPAKAAKTTPAVEVVDLSEGEYSAPEDHEGEGEEEQEELFN
jgi:hypothetical protein